MAKQRFRDVKQGHFQKKAPEKVKEYSKNDYYASSGLKIKAFLTDAFMLLMPIMYTVIYLIMDGRENFAAHRVEGWIYLLVPLITVQTLFMYFTGQTPGYRAYNITLVDEKTKKKPSLFIIIFRNISAILSFFTLFGWIIMFFRKDSKTLHDLLSNTALVNKK
jgi:uncharacterized RDD family membrane protein YckC